MLSANALLRPNQLAERLDLWALRREKVLALLDVRASRSARQLARTCRVLARSSYESSVTAEAWEAEWRRVREEVAFVLVHARPAVMSEPLEEGRPRSTSLVTPTIIRHTVLPVQQKVA